MADPEEVIVFFDGVCRFCNATINSIMSRDTARRLKFSPLQGKTFAEVKTRHPELEGVDSIIVLVRKDGVEKVYVRSRAAFQMYMRLPGIWKVIAWLRILPAWFCDPFYRLIAAMRYKLFGKLDACRIPTPEERAVFLD